MRGMTGRERKANLQTTARVAHVPNTSNGKCVFPAKSVIGLVGGWRVEPPRTGSELGIGSLIVKQSLLKGGFATGNGQVSFRTLRLQHLFRKLRPRGVIG